MDDYDSQSDAGISERGEQSSRTPIHRGGSVPFRSGGPKVLPIEHPSRNDQFPERVKPVTQGAKGTGMLDIFDITKLKQKSTGQLLELVFPCVGWLKSYKWKEDARADVIAGLTVGTMLVPQAMSYSSLAGLHPIYGLYSSFLPVIVYVIFGSSRQLSVGPVAMVSLLVSNALLSVAGDEDAEDAQNGTKPSQTDLAIQLALMIGIIECLMGLVRLGWLIRFISHSVVSGFTTASAIIIGLSQANSLLGYDITRSSQLLTIIQSIIDGSDGFLWQPLITGSVCLGLLLAMKQLGKSYKGFRLVRAAGPFAAIVISILFVKLFRPTNISLVGSVPQGFPDFTFKFDFSYARELLPHAFLISGVGILESVGIAKTLAARNGYEIDSNQELFGLGMCNLFGSLLSSTPVAGSFSRSAVMNESGARTGMTGVVIFAIIGASLLFLTPAFTDIPKCGLAAIVVSAVIGLLDYQEVIYLWKVEKRDLLLWTMAFLFTLFLGIEIGVLVGVGISLVFVIYESANPHTALLGRLPGTTVYRNVDQYPDVYTYFGIVIIRVDAPMYFANISVIKDRLCGLEHCVAPPSNRRRGKPVDKVSFIIFDMSPVTYIDSTAVHAIIELYYNCKSRQIQLAFCNPNRRVMTTLARAKVPDLLGREWYFVRVHDAVLSCISRSQLKQDRPNAERSDSLSIEVSDTKSYSRSMSWASDDSETAALLSSN